MVDIKYLFTPPSPKRSHYFYEELNDASEASRTAFFPIEYTVWKIDRAQDRYRVYHQFEYHVLRYVGSVKVEYITIPLTDSKVDKGWTFGEWFDLPVPPTLAASEQQLLVNKDGFQLGSTPVQFGLFSDGDWRISVAGGKDGNGDDWVMIGDPDKSGKATKDQDISVAISPNPNPWQRYATIYLYGTNDPKTGKQQRCEIKITQDPDTSKSWAIRIAPDEPVMRVGWQAGKYKLKLTATEDWTVSCKADWAHLSETSGGPTGSTPKEIVITVDENLHGGRAQDVVVRSASGQYKIFQIDQGIK